jgi:hypothetical protein
MRQPGQLILLFGNEAVHRRGRVAQRRPGVLDHFRRQHSPVEVEITVPQRFPAFPVVHSDRSDLSCIGLVTTLGEVVEDGLGVVGDARRGGELLAAEADRGASKRS